MFCTGNHPSLCPFHARKERQLLEADLIASELAGLSGGFRTANDVNRAIGKLLLLSAADRISSRKAALLAYMGQLLLHSLPHVRREYMAARSPDLWLGLVRLAIGKAFPQSQGEPAAQ